MFIINPYSYKKTITGYTNNLIPTMTSNTAPSGIASASSVYGSWEAYKAMDKSNSTMWSSITTPTVSSPQSLRYQFASGKVCAKYTIVAYGISEAVNAPKNWTFEGSNNGTDWTVLDTQTNQTGWTLNTKREYIFSNLTSYKYYEIKVTGVQTSGNYAQITELEIMEAIYG